MKKQGDFLNRMSTVTTTKSKRNGKIELFRFIFCICVLMFHLGKYLIGEPSLKKGVHLALFPHGAIGVEFFFLVSGYLMAKSIAKKQDVKENIFKSTFDFMKRKYFSIFPYHLFATGVVIILILFNLPTVQEMISYIIKSLPTIFLVQICGFPLGNSNHVTWYLSAMLVSMLLIYPICKKNYKFFVRFVAPALVIFFVGYQAIEFGYLTGVGKKTPFGYKSLIRAISEISLGIMSYDISGWLADRFKDNRGAKYLLHIVEFGCYFLTLAYVMLTMSKKYEFVALALLFIAITITFSNLTTMEKMNTKFIYFLGNSSLLIYLNHVAAIYVVKNYFGIINLRIRYQFMIAILITIVLSWLCKKAGNKLSQLIYKVI